jgi:hypothetical protein
MTAVQRITRTLKRLCETVTTEAARNPAFASSLENVLDAAQDSKGRQPKRSHRRAPGVVDPFAVFADSGDQGVRRSLSQLSIEQLKDIVAQHGMDRSKLAMKWKTAGRFVELILETVAARSRKGDAFR